MKLPTMAGMNSEKIWKAAMWTVYEKSAIPKVQMKQAQTPTTPAVSESQHITSEVVNCILEVSQNARDT